MFLLCHDFIALYCYFHCLQFKTTHKRRATVSSLTIIALESNGLNSDSDTESHATKFFK